MMVNMLYGLAYSSIDIDTGFHKQLLTVHVT